MEWDVETVLPHDVRRYPRQLSNQEKEIEEKDAVIALMNDDLRTVKTKYRPSSMKA